MKISQQTILLLVILAFLTVGLKAQSYKIESPSGNIKADIKVGEDIELMVFSGKKSLFEAKHIGMAIAGDAALFRGGKVLKAQRSSVNQVLYPVAPVKSSEVVDKYNFLSLDFGNYSFECRAYDEGLAYRFTGKKAGSITILTENLQLGFAGGSMAYFPEEQSFYSHNERYYQYEKLEEIVSGAFCSLPMLAVADGVNVLVTESDLTDYAGMWLKKEKGTLEAVFPNYPQKVEQTTDRDVPVKEREEFIAKTDGSRTFPWRIFAIAESDAGLLTNQLSWILSGENQLEETDWIRPGKVAWDWWNYNNIYGVDFEAGVNTETYKYYIDFASENGIEYIILDEGWYKLGDLMSIVPEIDMEELARYGKEKNVGLILWVVWKTLDDQLEEALDQFERWGVKGIKVDFMQRDDQWMVNYYERIAKEAAKRKMLVDFHGSYKPAGLHRRYPNVLTREGVCGLEQSKWTEKETPEHNVTLPFIRMVAGPMDYTPGAMINAAKGNYAPVFNQPMSQGTRCHQLAMYVVYESPLQMLADNPTNYRREPEIMQFLGPVPTTWDDTKILDARVADYVVTARRKGSEWYIGAMTDWDSRDLEVRLDFLEAGKKYKAIIYKDGKNAHRHGSDYAMEEKVVEKGDLLKMHLAPGGGWVARLQ